MFLLAISGTLAAQDTEPSGPDEFQAMLLLGVGKGSSARFQGEAVGLEGRIVVERLVLGAHYFELNETDPGAGVDPAQSTGDFSLLGGLSGHAGCAVRWSVVSGISYVGGRKRSDQLEFTEVNADGTTTDHYVSDRIDSVGLPLEVMVDFFFCKRFSLGAIGFSNLNPVNSYAGWMIGFRWGGSGRS